MTQLSIFGKTQITLFDTSELPKKSDIPHQWKRLHLLRNGRPAHRCDCCGAVMFLTETGQERFDFMGSITKKPTPCYSSQGGMRTIESGLTLFTSAVPEDGQVVKIVINGYTHIGQWDKNESAVIGFDGRAHVAEYADGWMGLGEQNQ